jgi:hypothetical protein
MMVTITKLPQMVRHGPVEIAVAVLPAAVTGAAIHGSSARPAAAGSRPTTGATLSVFGLRGHFPLEFWDHLPSCAFAGLIGTIQSPPLKRSCRSEMSAFQPHQIAELNTLDVEIKLTHDAMLSADDT